MITSVWTLRILSSYLSIPFQHSPNIIPLVYWIIDLQDTIGYVGNIEYNPNIPPVSLHSQGAHGWTDSSSVQTLKKKPRPNPIHSLTIT